MNKKTGLSRWAALTLMAGGAGVLVSETAGFTQVLADRGVSVGIAADENALLGLRDQSSGASIAGPDDIATVYTITDTTGAFTAADFAVAVVKLIDQSGTETTDPPVWASVSESSTEGEFTVDLSCSSETSDLGDSYQLVLAFRAANEDISIAGTRTTESAVDITCTFDYGETSNYRDETTGDAAQPTDPSGDIENPSAVNENDDDTSTAISSGGNEDLKVGYSLPSVDATASTYAMFFDIERIQVGNGSFGFSLVNSAGDELTSRQVLDTGENTYTFTTSENQAIVANSDDLYLIIDSATNGRGNREMSIDYFELVVS